MITSISSGHLLRPLFHRAVTAGVRPGYPIGVGDLGPGRQGRMTLPAGIPARHREARDGARAAPQRLTAAKIPERELVNGEQR